MKSQKKNHGSLTVGGLAKAGGVGLGTINYYQKLGLLSKPQKPNHGGFRTYDENHVRELLQIRSAQAFGFTLKEIEQLFAYRLSGNCGSVKPFIERKADEIKVRLSELNHARKNLTRLAECCHGNCKNGECPLFGMLSGEYLVSARE